MGGKGQEPVGDKGWPGALLWREVWPQVLGILYPGRCAGCRTVLPDTGFDGWCTNCRRTLTPLTAPFCTRCSLPVSVLPPLGGRGQDNSQSKGDHICEACRVNPPPQRFTLSCVEYGAAVERALVKLKYQGDFWVLKGFGHLWRGMDALSPRHDDGWLCQWTQYVVPVPLHRKRLRERGYDQAALIARSLARYMGKPLGQGFLQRRIYTRSQVGLSSAERHKNVEGAFVVPLKRASPVNRKSEGRVGEPPGPEEEGGSGAPGAPPFPRGARILLVDDTMTTGATVGEAAAALLAAGAGEVGVFTIARAVLM